MFFAVFYEQMERSGSKSEVITNESKWDELNEEELAESDEKCETDEERI